MGFAEEEVKDVWRSIAERVGRGTMSGEWVDDGKGRALNCDAGDLGDLNDEGCDEEGDLDEGDKPPELGDNSPPSISYTGELAKRADIWACAVSASGLSTTPSTWATAEGD